MTTFNQLFKTPTLSKEYEKHLIDFLESDSVFHLSLNQLLNMDLFYNPKDISSFFYKIICKDIIFFKEDHVIFTFPNGQNFEYTPFSNQSIVRDKFKEQYDLLLVQDYTQNADSFIVKMNVTRGKNKENILNSINYKKIEEVIASSLFLKTSFNKKYSIINQISLLYIEIDNKQIPFKPNEYFTILKKISLIYHDELLLKYFETLTLDYLIKLHSSHNPQGEIYDLPF